MSTFRQPTRRQFLALAGATTVLARTAESALAQEPTKPVSPNDRIRIALLGAGGMGQGDTETALKVPGVELVAAADIYDGRFEECRKRFGKDLQLTRDYREILVRKDVDAVIVGSPDHWHMQMTIDALEAGKDVYCEKPMMHAIDEGALMLATQKKTGRILQVGSLTLKVNFVDGGVTNEWGDSGFRFVGNEGLMELGGGAVSVARRPPLPRD